MNTLRCSWNLTWLWLPWLPCLEFPFIYSTCPSLQLWPFVVSNIVRVFMLHGWRTLLLSDCCTLCTRRSTKYKLVERAKSNGWQMQEKSRMYKVHQCARIVHLEFDWCSFAPNWNSNELWPRSQTIQNSCSQWLVPGKWNHRNRAKTSKTNKTAYFFVIVSDANRHCAAQWPHRLHIR